MDRLLNRTRRRSSIKKEFNEQDLQDLRTAFEMMDSNRDGCINAGELKQMLLHLNIELRDDTIDELVGGACHRSNGEIDENDFLAWIKKIEALAPSAALGEDKELMEAFRVFDLDNNGFITRDELRQAMVVIGEEVTEEELTDFINRADLDKDGKINYEEFAKQF